jgi:hypothetical protein
MRKILFFLIVFLISAEKSFSNTNKPTTSSLGCSSEFGQGYLKNIDKLKIKKIEIDTHDYRKWTVNGIRIITSRSRNVADKYKKRFNTTITITYENDIKCVFGGRIRHSGDEKDHISLLGNTIIQSVDVHLNNGNIRGITKFKLLRPKTRGKLEDEILLTQLLRNLNYLAPRTFKVSARINQANSIMIFQEKAAKELLEFNKRREGPILEGDERFFWKRIEKLPDNQLSNWSIGVVPLFNKSAKHMLAKQVNSRIIHKSEEHKNMSFNSLSNLNLIHLYYSNKFQNKKNNFHYFDYDLDNTLLGFFDPKNILKLDVYNLLIQATNSQHSLSTNNRKFYWNSIENYFEPINYDSNSNIDAESPSTTTAIYRLPISNQFFKAFDILENKLKNLDLAKLHKNINFSGANMSHEGLNAKIDKIHHNLSVIKKNYLNANKELIEENKFKPINNILSRFNETLNEIDPNVYLVKHRQDNGQLQRCKIFLEMCEDYNFSTENLSDLLEGELILDKQIHQYLGKSLNFENIIKGRKYNKLKFKKSTIFYDEGIEIKKISNENTLDIYQNTPGSRLYIINGKIENLKINFNGYKIKEKGLNLKVFPKNYPVDINGLTGCLSLINLEVKNVSINANESSCEDTVNFINVSGSFNEINIKNSFSDGLDVDFSNLEIDSIKIDTSLNDCVDFSAGNYKLNQLNLKNCGDKALSVGEKSFVILNEITAENVNMGIASKDSSIVKLNVAHLKNLKTCVSAYNKKQEFNGGFIEMKNMECENYDKKVDVDVYSKILKKNEILKDYGL